MVRKFLIHFYNDLIPSNIRTLLTNIRDWFIRFVYAQHNARVIADFENRMSTLLERATGGVISKPYCKIDVMLDAVEEFHNLLYDAGRLDAYEEMGVEFTESEGDQE